jgi:small nuclear ribonucleoprotein (snRNP)-like protein
MQKLIYILTVLLSISTFSQQKAFEITNIESGKTKIYEENQRVKIRTIDRKKVVGELHFIDNQTILVNSETIKIDSVLSIKSQPKVLGTLKTAVLITGLAIVGTSVIVATGGGNAAFLLFAVGSGVTIGAGVLEGLNSNNSNRKWTFKIIEK